MQNFLNPCSITWTVFSLFPTLSFLPFLLPIWSRIFWKSLISLTLQLLAFGCVYLMRICIFFLPSSNCTKCIRWNSYNNINLFSVGEKIKFSKWLLKMMPSRIGNFLIQGLNCESTCRNKCANLLYTYSTFTILFVTIVNISCVGCTQLNESQVSILEAYVPRLKFSVCETTRHAMLFASFHKRVFL